MRRYNIILAQPMDASPALVAAARSVWLWKTLCDGGPPLTRDKASQLVKTRSNSTPDTDRSKSSPSDSSFDGSKPRLDGLFNNGRTFDTKKGKQSKMNNGYQYDNLSNDGETVDVKQSKMNIDTLSNDRRVFNVKQKGKQTKMDNDSHSSTHSLPEDGRTFDSKRSQSSTTDERTFNMMNNGSQSSNDSLSNDGNTIDVKQKGMEVEMNNGSQPSVDTLTTDERTFNTKQNYGSHSSVYIMSIDGRIMNAQRRQKKEKNDKKEKKEKNEQQRQKKKNAKNDGSNQLKLESLWRLFESKTKSSDLNDSSSPNQRKPQREFDRCRGSLDKVLDVLVKNNLIKIVEPRPEDLQSSKQLDQTMFCKYHQTFGHDTQFCFTLKSKIQDLIDEGVISKEKKVGS